MRQAQAGFTLIELLVCLTVLAFGALVAMPLIRAGASGQLLRIAANDIAATARMTRAAAIRAGAAREMTIDLAGRMYWAEGIAAPRRLSQGISAEVHLPPGDASTGSLQRIRFMPGGATTGGRIVLHNGASRAMIEIDWLTGGAHVVGAR